jgi:hypothetical protein
MARPTKLTDEVREKLLEATRAGCTLKDAAAYAGVSVDSFSRYRARDPELAAALEQAEGTAAVGYSLVLWKAAESGDWRAALAWLERRRPAQWALRHLLEHTVKEEERDDGLAGWDADRLTTEQLLQLQELSRIAYRPALPEETEDID